MPFVLEQIAPDFCPQIAARWLKRLDVLGSQFSDLGKARGVGYGQVGEYLTVKNDSGAFQAVHELTV